MSGRRSVSRILRTTSGIIALFPSVQVSSVKYSTHVSSLFFSRFSASISMRVPSET